ncbi:secretory lipase [Lentzea atacamensis]|uniref:Secretory lipase n=2 Tax=Lentzea TaxID=165301 RepID=A0A316HZ60_9PSEU|nr:lipase family protein [Lentzea atacamensis]PWK85451.1 secretory lipase [Lentzea atacamensis]RAS66853.1 secretory lipase [Lentzea atacamensis]
MQLRTLLTAVLLLSALVTPAAAAAPGELVSSREVAWHPEPLRLLPAPVKAYEIRYRSTSATGTGNVVSGMVLVSPLPWTNGPRPIVAYAMGTQGMADRCAPSQQLQNGTEVEIAFLAQAMFNGWAVAVTDYEGLGTPGDHTYAVARSEGRALLDVARAASNIPGLSVNAPIGVFGYSQGGQAASAAAEQWKSYAPALNVVGVAAGGVPADLNAVAKFNDGNAGSGLVFAAAAGYAAAYPELPLAEVLNARGRQVIDQIRNSCVAEIALVAPFTRLNALTTRPDVILDPLWQKRLTENALGSVKPAAPVYLYHGTIDELIPFSVGQKLRSQWCSQGADVQWTALPLLGHIAAVSAWGSNALNWLGDRFAGKVTHPNC